MYFKHTFYYWKKHIRMYGSILFTIMLGMIAIIISTFLVRSQVVTNLEKTLNNGGFYDLAIYNVPEEIKTEITKDDRIEESGVVYCFGNAVTKDGMGFPIGAVENAATEEMLHLTPIEGRYPEAEGEITIDKITMRCMGLEAKLGTSIELELQNEDGTKIEKKRYTVVGIIEQRYMSELGEIYTRRKYQPEEIMEGQENMECPYAYISMKELKNFDVDCKEVLFANVKLGQDYDDVSVREELLEQYGDEICLDYNASTRSLFADSLSGYKKTDDGSLDVASGYQNAIERINTDSTEKDFYSRVLIPLFALLIAIVTFFSLFEAFGRLILSRKKEMGMYRCLGMNKLQMVLMVLTELLFVTIPGVILGCIFGTFGYMGILWIENHCFHMRILSALKLDSYFAPFIEAATLDPYQYAIGLIGITLVISIVIPIWKNVKLSPVEACRKQGKVKKESIKYKIALGINISILLVSITTGYLYFSSQITSENMLLEEQAQTCLVDGTDYVMEKNESYSVKSGDEYRHDAGVSSEALAKLEANANVDSVHAIKIAHGTHFVYEENKQSEEVATYLEPDLLLCEWPDDDLDNPYDKAVFERFDLDRKQKGYKKSERVYKISTTAMSEEELNGFSEYLIQGELDFEAINKGEEIILVNRNDGMLPYKVGDQITMNVNLYPEEQDASSDYFRTGNVEGMEPNFTDYIGEWYSIGKRKDWTVKVGAILYLTDEEKANFYLSENGTGLNVFTTIDGMASWDTLDENYTKVAVKLKEKADYSDFETCWYQMLQQGKLMITKSLDGIRSQIRENFGSSMAIFIAMAGMMILISFVGILNAVSMQVLQEKKRTSMMRAIGASKAQMRRSMQKRWVGMVLFGGILAEAVTIVILYLHNYVEQKVNSYLEGSLELELTWWGFEFPFSHIEKTDCIAAVCVTIVMLLLMVLVAGGVYQYMTRKESIAEAMREE